VAAGVAGCASRRQPVLEPLHAAASRTPVVLIPGIGGSKLRDPESGKLLWGKARSAFFPRDGAYRIARPIDPAPDWIDDVEAFDVLTRFRFLGVFRVEVYASLIRMMERNGYQLGDLSNPRPSDTFFVFPYDMRYTNVEVVKRLTGALENLRRVRGDDVLEVNFICHSNAAHVARYFIKYGDGTIEQAERGEARRPTGVRVEKLILVGPANGGSLTPFHSLNRGRRYFPLVGRKFRPEVMFTFRSLYGILPAYRQDLFFDEQGRDLDVDLFDAENWRRYGWSVFDQRVQRRLAKQGSTELFGDEEWRFAYLSEMLDRARRMQALLVRDVEDFGDTRYYLLQNVHRPTGDRAVIAEVDGEWKTYFSSDRRIKEDEELTFLASSPGDGLATVDSQSFLSPQEMNAIAAGAQSIPSRHRKIIQHPETRRLILEYLAEELPAARRNVARSEPKDEDRPQPGQ
jgi:hypothetical protein